MIFNKRTFEQFAMQVETSSHNAAIDAYGLSVDAISNKLGIGQDEGRALAKYMKEIGWAELSRPHTPCLTLTPKGHEEIAKLRRPKMERWFDAHPKTTTTIISIGTSSIVVVLAELLKNLLWPK